jgi:fibronectin type 3 domain-containing protein
MKNIFKVFGIIVIVAVIGFFFLTCDNDGNGDGNNLQNGNENTNDNGNDNNNGDGNGGNTVTKPNAPTGVTARAISSDTIRISWSAVSGATNYKVYYSSYSGQDNPSLTVTVTTTSYERTSLVSDSTYYFKVSAVNSAGEGTASSVVSAKTNKFGTPGIPTGVTAAPLSASSIQITWLSPSGTDKPSGYTIYRSTVASGTFPSIANTSNLTYTDTGLNPSTTYYYFVKAYNSYGDGSVSSTASATTTAASSGGGGGSGASKPSAPTGVTATRQSASNVYITWNSVSGATSYKIYWSYTASGTYSYAGTTTSTNYTDSGWGASESGYIKVSAVNSAGEGVLSSYASFPAYSSGGDGGGSTWPPTVANTFDGTGVTTTTAQVFDGTLSSTSSVLWYKISWPLSLSKISIIGIDRQGSSSYTADIVASFYGSSGSLLEGPTNIGALGSIDREVSSLSTYYIKVEVNPSNPYTGTFRIGILRK